MLTKGTVVQRNPGEMWAGEKAIVVQFLQQWPGTTCERIYQVRREDGKLSSWSDRCFHVLKPRPLQDVVQNVEDHNVTQSRGGGLKFDGGKQRPALLHEGMPLALAEVVKTLTFGAQKYEAHSWQKVENAAERYQDASYRHDSQRCKGEVLDPETGIMHRAHHIINELFVLELELRAQKRRE
ncbi:hypothetical protein [Xanthomonas phage f20-Xaj]|uniref:dATP/dGTP diphosphohydrolase N-terminal domain-containing protein n=1 Tax=Xanthomonas phage f20-Xaj TaxID=1784979 RepID=A0A127AVT7_9CAUD|nr:hypothetical protein FDI07_gp43 [Xanthomonas phage f20-Xaj]AMM44633.1 hypothetical protein [Xanthomonas phage f20-Xaj]